MAKKVKRVRSTFQYRVLSNDKKPILATNDEGEARRFWSSQPYGARFQKRTNGKWRYDPE